MCGIVGIVGNGNVAPHLMDGLRRLQYRGYDSAGIATLVGGRIERRRAQGKLANLDAILEQQPLSGNIGIGHTRWATHGRPSEINAHPHATDRVALVHNGIIENFQELRAELESLGIRLSSETDTEVVAHLLTHYVECGYSPEQAMECTMSRLKGAFALAALFQDRSDMILVAKRGSPLALGFGEAEMYLGSDAMAMAPFTDQVTYLQEDDWAIVTRRGAEIYNIHGRVDRPVQRMSVASTLVGKGQHAHFMMKEIAEQPTVISETLRSLMEVESRRVSLPPLPIDFAQLQRLSIVACGTAQIAGHVAKYWLENVAGLPVDLDIASEHRYRRLPANAGTALLVISQSGETADTIGALRHAKSHGQSTLAVLNVPGSTIGRESDGTIHTLAGTEIGVAATKTFTTQLTVLACLTIAAGRARGTITADDESALSAALVAMPGMVAEVLDNLAALPEIASRVAEARDVLYLGRGTSFPIALEGALKLKEISYIHAEGYAAGEMKHGPIALVDSTVPVVVVAPSDELFEKTYSNLQEVLARGAPVILVTDTDGARRVSGMPISVIALPNVHPFVAPILYTIPMQLIAYYAAVAKGTDVDQPRNLAKSVTVE